MTTLDQAQALTGIPQRMLTKPQIVMQVFIETLCSRCEDTALFVTKSEAKEWGYAHECDWAAS